MQANRAQCVTDRMAIGWVVAALAAALATGCSSQNQPSQSPSQSPPSSPNGDGLAPLEYWDVTYSDDGDPVGQLHFRREVVDDQGRRLLHSVSEQTLKIRRGGAGDVAATSIHLETWATMAGELVRFASSMDSGDAPLEVQGRVAEGTLHQVMRAGQRPTKSQHAWRSDWGGYFAVEDSLRRRPLAPGDSRKLTALIPGLNLAGEFHMQADDDYREEPLLQGRASLLRVAVQIQIDKVRLQQEFWCNRSGEAIKQRDPQVGLTTYRATREAALAAARSGTSLQFTASTKVPVDGPLGSPHNDRRRAYVVTLSGQPAADVFPQSPLQRVRQINEHTVEVTVICQKPGEAGPPGAAASQPVDGDLSPSALIQSDDPRVVQLARSVAPGESDAARLAVALERLVHERVQKKDYTRAFDSAADVARKLQGDCTEHAVLLAAVCRARGLPARVANGLVAFQGDFAYHMWTEVYLEARQSWTPLDATLGQGGVGAGHIKMTHSSLESSTALQALLPVLQVLGKLKIEALPAE